MNLVTVLPPVLAVLNVTAASLACVAYFFVRRGNHVFHATLMVTALTVSTLFLISYLYYHYQVGNVSFAGQGVVRVFYFSVLVSHVLLATVMVPLILATLTRAVRGTFDSHRRLARWTLPLWVYVSVTGVVIYLMAFQFYPPTPMGTE